MRPVRRASLAPILALACALPALGAGGDLDPDFSGDGRVRSPADHADGGCHALALQPDGKIVAVGPEVTTATEGAQTYRCAAIRWNADGTLDSTFGTAGRVIVDVGVSSLPNAICIQADGKIVIAGLLEPALQAFVVRLNTDGSLDTTFDGDGLLLNAFGTAGGASHINQQSDGKLVLSGGMLSGLAICARLDVNGTLDPTFDTDGVATITLPDTAYISSAAIQPDGRILLAGASGSNYALIRLLASGALDSTFGTAGISIASPVSEGAITAIALQTDGRIVCGGTNGAPGAFVVGRFLANGALDSSFGDAGVTVSDFSEDQDRVQAIAIQPNGKIVAAGLSFTGLDLDFAAARYTPNGDLDNGFGTGGFLTVSMSAYYDEIRGLTIQPDGNIVAGGLAWNGAQDHFAICRLKTSGGLDADFDEDGRAFAAVKTTDDSLRAVTLQTDGKILAAGSSGGVACLARYLTNGKPDESFGRAGFVAVNLLYGTESVFTGVTTLSDGRIIAVGRAGTEFAVARFDANGIWDQTLGDSGLLMPFIGGEGSEGRAIVTLADDSVVIAGHAIVNGASHFAVGKLDSEGASDQEFGPDGGGTAILAIGSSSAATAVLVQPDGRIVLGGHASNGGNFDFALARFDGDGLVDTSFGTDGIVTTDMGDLSDGITGLALQNGFVVAGGVSGQNIAVARYQSSGALDLSFSGDGKVLTSVGNTAHASSVAVRNGKIVVAGYATQASATDFLVVRYLGDGSLDGGFGSGGIALTDFEGGTDEAHAMAIGNNNKIYAVGLTTSGGQWDFGLARYTWN